MSETRLDPPQQLRGVTRLVATASACVLDAARLPELPATLEGLGARHRTLFEGESAVALADVAPYVVRLEGNAATSDWLARTIWGQSAGILLVTEASTRQLRKHFRSLLMVLDESGETLYFRCYDPRVLRAFLPTCTGIELDEVFGPIDAFILEDEDPTRALRFSRKDGELVTEAIALTDPIDREAAP